MARLRLSKSDKRRVRGLFGFFAVMFPEKAMKALLVLDGIAEMKEAREDLRQTKAKVFAASRGGESITLDKTETYALAAILTAQDKVIQFVEDKL